jgi:hypothetical protein
MATPHRLLAAVYTQGPRFAGFEQQVRRRDTHSQEVSLSCLTAAVVAICCLLPSAFYLLSVAQDAQDFLYFLLERAAEELKEASDSASPACLPPRLSASLPASMAVYVRAVSSPVGSVNTNSGCSLGTVLSSA